jgi:ABC-type phosphate/phosphonate transport system substrate-binding protein
MIASTRMYNVAPAATAAWHRLLHRVIRDSGLALDIVDHPHPASLESLWARDDLACGFMCGWPLAKDPGSRQAVAAPIPAGSDGPRYHAVFVVAADSPFSTVADSFGQSFAFNARGSHSGWNMPKAHVARLGGHFAVEKGPYGPHQRSAAAVASGEASIAALDSLVWALLCRHAPDQAAGLRVVGQTADQPSPPIVASVALAPGDAARLRRALVGLADDPTGRALLADVCLSGFAPATLADYDETLRVR